MGKKSRLKQEKKQRQMEESIKKPVETETKTFLRMHGVDEQKSATLVSLVSMIVNFMIYRSLKAGIQLPSVRPNEEELDENRIEALHTDLRRECDDLGVGWQEVMDHLVSPLAGNEALVGQLLRKNYDLLESLIPSDSFRQMTEGQIENPDTWGDSLTDYETRKDDYYEAVKEVFALNLGMVRADLDGEEELPDLDGGLGKIKDKYRLHADDVERLRRRATEFLRVAFANYLEMDFQLVREDVDIRFYGMKPEKSMRLDS
jgi:hypothetical protein